MKKTGKIDKLWAPWRRKYIYLRNPKGCIFCVGQAKGPNDKKNYIIRRTKSSFSMLNIYPYNSGHLMVAPYKHEKDFSGLSSEELLDLVKLLSESLVLLKKKLKPDGFNVGINIGKVGGAGFSGHMHIHIVPRWNGDTNFMPIIADTKVVSESLSELYGRLKSDN